MARRNGEIPIRPQRYRRRQHASASLAQSVLGILKQFKDELSSVGIAVCQMILRLGNQFAPVIKPMLISYVFVIRRHFINSGARRALSSAIRKALGLVLCVQAVLSKRGKNNPAIACRSG